MDLKEMKDVDPSKHWYYQSKLLSVRMKVQSLGIKPKKIIDVGAGSGFFSISLASDYSDCKVVCIDTNYLEDSQSRDGSIMFTNSTVPLQGDLYLLMDVLEHVENDQKLLIDNLEMANPGSIVLITVPAFKSLWSSHDVFLEHFRRYRIKDLIKIAESCDLRIIESHYLFSFLFPIVWIGRKLHLTQKKKSDMREFNRLLNKLLTKICSFEHKKIKNNLFGISIILVAEKNPRIAK
jgi:2-polyprenyl-3-methyl-5-hydroxy-6-metoxy-1,4-benzoquinol methylase